MLSRFVPSMLCAAVLLVSPCVSQISLAAAPEPEPEIDAAPPFRLMSEKKDLALREKLPRVEDAKLQEILDDPYLILYTETEMPKAYQEWSGQLTGVHSPSYNLSANGSEPFGNGNIEFPWGTPAGTHRAKHVSSFRFLWLPRDAQGKMLPVVWFRRRLSRSAMTGYAWRFPVGARVGEVLMLRSPQGQRVTFELRVRKRERDDWAVDVFRPFPNAAALEKRIKQLNPKWKAQPAVAKLVSHLSSPIVMTDHTLRDRHPYLTFKQKMGIDTLPAIEDDALVTQLLTQTTFKSAHGELWRAGKNGRVTCAPTTRAEYHVVPAHYDAGFIEVDRQSCMRCHKTVNQHVTRFEPGRDWYGRIRGSDGIFSFHPFSKGTISYNGYGNSVRMRSSMVTAGVIAHFDLKQHPHKHYTQIPHLKE